MSWLWLPGFRIGTIPLASSLPPQLSYIVTNITRWKKKTHQRKGGDA